MKSLLLCLQHDKYLLELMNTLKTSNISNENTSLLSLLYNASILVRKRVLEQLNVVKILLERLKTLGSSIRQYGEQHHAMVSELASTRTTGNIIINNNNYYYYYYYHVGINHPFTLSTLNNLCHIYINQSKFDEAFEACKLCLEKRKLVLGNI